MRSPGCLPHWPLLLLSLPFAARRRLFCCLLFADFERVMNRWDWLLAEGFGARRAASDMGVALRVATAIHLPTNNFY